MANESLVFDILARDRASQTLDKIGRSAETVESRFASFQRTAKNFAGAIVGGAVAHSVLEAADSFEKSRSRLEQITQNVGSTFEGISGQVDKADAQLAKFGFTSADTEGALASLETATRNPTKALQDLALAADIARGRNISLETATQILQRVETGHVAMLGRLGIATKDAAGHTLTQAQALQQLANIYGGAASRYADTFAGKQAAVRAEMQNSAAQIGVALLPAATELANVLARDVLPPVVSLARWLDRNRSVIEPLVKTILLGVGAWKAYRIAVATAAAAQAVFNTTAAATATAGAAGAAGAGAAAETGLLAGAAGFARSIPIAGALGYASYKLTSNALNDFFPRQTADEKTLDKLGPAGKTFAENLIKEYGSLDAGLKAVQAQNQATAASQATLNAALKTAGTVSEAAAKNLIGVSSAQDQFRQALHQAAQTAADQGRVVTGNSDAAMANRDALRAQVSAVFGVIDAMAQQGRSARAQSDMLDVLTQAVETNATKLYGDKTAVDAFLTSLGLIPGHARAAVDALAALAQAQAVDAAWAAKTDLPGRATKSPAGAAALPQALADAKNAATAAAEAATDAFTTGFSPTVAKSISNAAKQAADAAKQQFDSMKQQMQSDLQSIASAANSTRDSLMGMAQITDALHGTDIMGNSAVGNVLNTRRQQAARLKEFATEYARLAALGLNATDLHQFIQAGPDAIPAMRQIIASGRRGVRQINALERQINATATRLGAQDAVSQDGSLIHKDLVSLPAKLATPFIKGLKGVHIDVNLREIDRRNGMRVVAAVS